MHCISLVALGIAGIECGACISAWAEWRSVARKILVWEIRENGREEGTGRGWGTLLSAVLGLCSSAFKIFKVNKVQDADALGVSLPYVVYSFRVYSFRVFKDFIFLFLN